MKFIRVKKLFQWTISKGNLTECNRRAYSIPNQICSWLCPALFSCGYLNTIMKCTLLFDHILCGCVIGEIATVSVILK